MDQHVSGQAETDEDILTFRISDEALERAADADGMPAITWQFCTHVWTDCGWPQ
ncbi:MAG TPA: hypothetical protein VH206_04345 [Xanthobacteraceae bacterium]|jgi:hypothetical protein|nr:hypothetical protein [Xanthobacteraceae bacterium]